jgi:prepilin-type N-terminal cleavage/methylation domain-containing protein
MQNSKSAFTMLELIFVIVIIGVLSSVALPRLSATRDDAKVSVLAKAIQSIKSEISTAIIATNQVPTTTAQMKSISNTMSDLPNFVIVNDKVINIIDTDNSSEVCKVLTIDDSNSSNVKLLLSNGLGRSSICKGLQKLIPDNNIGFTIAGNIVNY